MSDSYFGEEGFAPIRLSSDGYYATGDLGYVLGHELVITGRHKEMILHNGRNIWPQDLEAAVAALDEVPAKRVIAFALDAGETTQINILAEVSGTMADQLEIWRKKIIAALFSASGVTVQVQFVPLRTLPVTSSGKLARALARQNFMRGDYEVF